MTQSTELLDAMSSHHPTVTVAELADGETRLRNVDDAELMHWLKSYSLGDLQRSGELEKRPRGSCSTLKARLRIRTWDRS